MAQAPKPREAGATHSRPAGLSPRELMPYTLPTIPSHAPQKSAEWGGGGMQHRPLGESEGLGTEKWGGKSPRCSLLSDGGLDPNIRCVESCQLYPLPQMAQAEAAPGPQFRKMGRVVSYRGLGRTFTICSVTCLDLIAAPGNRWPRGRGHEKGQRKSCFAEPLGASGWKEP